LHKIKTLDIKKNVFKMALFIDVFCKKYGAKNENVLKNAVFVFFTYCIKLKTLDILKNVKKFGTFYRYFCLKYGAKNENVLKNAVFVSYFTFVENIAPFLSNKIQ
jgi:hypothetical protein